jgi:quercetin dioxygenase-like cupin family protein
MGGTGAVGKGLGENTLSAQSSEEVVMEAVKDASHLYEVERRAMHAERPGFRINEIQISPSQKVPWHYHNNVQDAFYVLQGRIRIFLRDPREDVRLGPGETFSVAPKRPHLVVNGGEVSATFLVLQGLGEYDFVPLT